MADYEPLTDDELDRLESGVIRTQLRIRSKAAAQIRGLKAENAKLREYAVHPCRCDRHNYGESEVDCPCTCGLGELLKGDDDEA